MTFKEPKTTREMINHLKENKNITFQNNIDEKKAQDILLQYDYINIITPFKYFSCTKIKGDSGTLIPKKINGNHIYEFETSFDEYVNKFREEREKYPKIYESIIDFELKLKSIIVYHVFNDFNISSEESYCDFFDELKLGAKNYPTRRDNMIADFDKLKSEAGYIDNFYNHFDHMSLKNHSNIFHCLGSKTKKKVFDDLLKYGATLDRPGIEGFEKRLFETVSLRNTIMHGNSTTILVRYRNTKRNEFRSRNERKIFSKLIDYFENEYKVGYKDFGL